jgi:GntR family transcriptional regulator
MHELTLHILLAPSSGVPLYRQLQEQLLALIASGRLAPGDMLPSVRQLAAALDINMMTVSKVYSRMEADGVIERLRGTGMRVAPRTTPPSVASRQAELAPLAQSLVARGAQLQLAPDEILDVVRTALTQPHSITPNGPSTAST